MRAAVIGLHIEGFCGAAGWANSQLDLSDGIESSSLPSLLRSSCSLCLLFFSDVFVCSSYSPFSPSLLWTSVLTNCASRAALIHLPLFFPLCFSRPRHTVASFRGVHLLKVHRTLVCLLTPHPHAQTRITIRTSHKDKDEALSS